MISSKIRIQTRHFATHANDTMTTNVVSLPPHRLVKVNCRHIEDVFFAVDEEDYNNFLSEGFAAHLSLDATGTSPGTPGGRRYVRTPNGSGNDVSIHRLIMSAEIEDEAQRRDCEPRSLVVDHINGDALDNRRANLRVGTQSQNLASPQRKKTTKHETTSDQVGVYYDKTNDRWYARIMKENSVLRGTSFKTEGEAKKWYTIEKAKHAREIGMDVEPPTRLPGLAEVHERIDAWYIANATGESEEVRARRVGKKVEYNQGLKRELQIKRTRELADVTKKLSEDPNNIDLINKKRKLERAETVSQVRGTGEKMTKEERQKNINEGRVIRAAAERASERKRLENCKQTSQVKAKLKKLDMRERMSKARLEGKQVDEQV